MNLIDLREKKIKNDANTRIHPNDANKLSDPNLRIHPNDPNREKRTRAETEGQNNVKRSDLQNQEEVRPQQEQAGKPAPLLKASNASLPIVWEAEEFEYHRKDGTWFLSAGIIGMALLAFAAMTKNFLMIPLIFIFAFVVYVFAVKKPRMMEFEISGDGVAMKPIAELDSAIRGEGKFFPFKDFSSFWIFRRAGGMNEVSFETNKLLYPHLKIPLADEIDAEDLRSVLANFVEEKEQEESLSEILAGWLRF